MKSKGGGSEKGIDKDQKTGDRCTLKKPWKGPGSIIDTLNPLCPLRGGIQIIGRTGVRPHLIQMTIRGNHHPLERKYGDTKFCY